MSQLVLVLFNSPSFFLIFQTLFVFILEERYYLSTSLQHEYSDPNALRADLRNTLRADLRNALRADLRNI